MNHTENMHEIKKVFRQHATVFLGSLAFVSILVVTMLTLGISQLIADSNKPYTTNTQATTNDTNIGYSTGDVCPQPTHTPPDWCPTGYTCSEPNSSNRSLCPDGSQGIGVCQVVGFSRSVPGWCCKQGDGRPTAIPPTPPTPHIPPWVPVTPTSDIPCASGAQCRSNIFDSCLPDEFNTGGTCTTSGYEGVCCLPRPKDNPLCREYQDACTNANDCCSGNCSPGSDGIMRCGPVVPRGGSGL